MKRVYIIFIMLAFSYISKAQDGDGIVVGAKVGGNISYLWGQGTSGVTVKPMAGLNVGAYLKYGIMDKLSIQPELLFSTRGLHIQRYSESFDDNNVNNPQLPSAGFNQNGPYSYRTKVNIFYLDLPVMINYQVIENLNVQAGPVVSLNIWDSYPKTYTSENVRISSDKNFTKINPWEFAAAIGATYKFEFQGKVISAGARYNVGLTRINEALRATDDLKSSMFQLFLAYDITSL